MITWARAAQLLLLLAKNIDPSSSWDTDVDVISENEIEPSNPSYNNIKRDEYLCWSEEFDKDLSSWTHLVTGWRGGNGEFQYYRNDRKNSYIEDGILHIKPTLTRDEFDDDFLENGIIDLNNNPDPNAKCTMEPCTITAGDDIINPIQSARMDSNASFTFRYGRVEVRAKMPRGDWLWPAIWMKPSHNNYGPWPISGEIDITEVRGNRFIKTSSGERIDLHKTTPTLHWGMNKTTDKWRLSTFPYYLNGTPNLADNFHTYGMEWTEDYFRFSLDGMTFANFPIPDEGFWKYGGFEGDSVWGNTKNAPFDDEYFFILNLAVGGVFFPDGPNYKPCSKPWKSKDTTPMRNFWDDRDCWYNQTWDNLTSVFKIDYIRVYTYDNSICNVKKRNDIA